MRIMWRVDNEKKKCKQLLLYHLHLRLVAGARSWPVARSSLSLPTYKGGWEEKHVPITREESCRHMRRLEDTPMSCHVCVSRERRMLLFVCGFVCFWVLDPFSVKLLVFIMASCCSSSSSSSSSSTTSRWVFPVIYLVLLCLLHGGGTTEAKCYSTIFGFGDSKTDTGQMQTAFPFQTAAEFWPYGRTFFGRPVNRYCDGRLVIDFMSEHWVPIAPIWVVLLVGYDPVSC
jgi:hypothetical protein